MARSGNLRLTSGIILILIGAAGYWFGLQIELDSNGSPGPRIFPLLASTVILVSGIHEIWTSVTVEHPPAQVKGTRPVLWLLVLSIAYVLLIMKVGYLVGTGIVAPLAAWLFGTRNRAGLLVIAIACPLTYHVIFFELLGVFPPYGGWFDILDLLQGP